MNPFDLPGPQFLAFYIVLSLVVNGVVLILRRTFETGPTPRIDVSDPLLIAYLRGGHTEALRVAAVSLIDRGLLTCSGTILTTAKHARPESVRRPIEKELLTKFAEGGQSSSMFRDVMLKFTLENYELQLTELRLLPDNYIRRGRAVIFPSAVMVLTGVSVVKILIAFQRGRFNVGFLMLLTVISVVIAFRLSFPRLTQTGKNLLSDLKELYSDLKTRAPMFRPGGATLEAMMLTAVFGVSALGGDGFAYTKSLFPKAQSTMDRRSEIHVEVLMEVRAAAQAHVVVAVAAEDVAAVEVKNMTTGKDRFGLGWRRQLAFEILSNLDRIDLVEVIADDLFSAPRNERRAVKTLAAQVPVTLHGVTLGLASSVPVQPRRLDQTARLCEEVGPISWSEHLAFVRGGGIEIGHLAAPPRCDETIEGTLKNLSLAHSIVGVPPQLENVATLIDPPMSCYDEASWISKIISNSQSDLLLDLHNLHANAVNFGFDPVSFITRVPVDRVKAIHLAGGKWVGKGNDTRVLDDHLHDVPEPVFALLEEVGANTEPGLTIILERDGHFPPIESLLNQLEQARQALARGRDRRTRLLQTEVAA